jgi:zinc protease
VFPFDPQDIPSRRCANGLIVMALEYHKLPLVHVSVMINRGAEGDPPGKEGLADLTAEGLLLGTTTMESEQISLHMEQLGARYSSSSGWDASYLEVFGMADDFLPLLQLVSDLLQHPVFSKEELRQAVERRISTITHELDQAEIVADQLIIKKVMDDTRYGHPIHGTLSSLRTLNVDNPASHYAEHYAPEHTCVLVIGDLDPDTVFDDVEAHLGQWDAISSVYPPPTAARPAGTTSILVVNRPDLSQSQIRLGMTGIKRNDSQYLPFTLMNYILGGGGFSSRLMQRIRAEKGFTYGIRSSFRAGRIPGPFMISTFTPTATTVPVVQEVLQVMRDFRDRGATAHELDEAQDFHVGNFPLRLETPAQLAHEILRLVLFDIPLEYLTSYRDRVRALSLEDVHRVTTACLHPDAQQIVVVGRADDFLAELHGLGTVRVIDYADVVSGNMY